MSSRIPRRISQNCSAVAWFLQRRESSSNDELQCSKQIHLVASLLVTLFINRICRLVASERRVSVRPSKLITAAFSLLMACTTAFAAAECEVVDPDLAQGTYSGGCKNGLADGYGEVSGASSYRGDFQAGKKHGKGIKVMPNGDLYVGDFDDDYRHGKGTYIWGARTPWAGDRYEGEYHRDKRQGWGAFQWNSGDRYEGPWQNDLRMGPSVMELRRAQAAEAAAKSVKVGIQVCAEARLGLVNRQRLRGKVENRTGESVQVRILDVDGGIASYRGIMVKAGDLMADAATNWQICGDD